MESRSWQLNSTGRRQAFTLVELMLVLAILAVMAYFAVTNFQNPLRRGALPESAERFRSLISMTRANAMLGGLRYRIRFLTEDDEEFDELPASQRLQPYVEFENEPIDYPGEYVAVAASWAQQRVFLGDVWCYDIRIGEPTFEAVELEVEEQEFDDEEDRKEEFGLDRDDSWALVLNPDGTSEWMTWRLVNTPYDGFDEGNLEEYEQLSVIFDGRLGTIFLQRPLDDDEIDILLDRGHSALLRRDFVTQRRLTEDDVLEINMGER